MLQHHDLWVDPTVSKKALNQFMKTVAPGVYSNLHALEILYHGKMVVRLAPMPYSVTDRPEIYSLSKSFTSTAIGMLVMDGKLSVEDRIIDIFPEKAPAEPSEYLKQMKVKHVLSMSTGHPACVMNKMHVSDDPVRTFMTEEVTMEPGTRFIYNTGATLLLSCIVEKLTGMRLIDFLSWRLFMPLGICGVRWGIVDAGQNEGGCGLHVTIDDIAKFGLLYINKGVWNGKRLLPEEWVEQATHKQIENASGDEIGKADWSCGYGYQFWMNLGDSYRGDGAYGQLCVVLPKQDMVIAIQAEVGSIPDELTAAKVLADHLFDPDDTPFVEMPQYAIPASKEPIPEQLFGRYFKMDENIQGWTGVYFMKEEATDGVSVVMSNGRTQYILKAGNGKWEESTFYAPNFQPKLQGLMSNPVEESRMASCYVSENGVLTVHALFLNSPHRVQLHFKTEGDTLHIDYEELGFIQQAAHHMTGKALS